jgi:8-oxo-dGTP pyrophosphatase MutT (NUDIX family)
MTTYTLESSRDWYNNLPGKRASAAMVITYDDTYLMIKDDYKKAMTFPGGNIDPDESAKRAAIRETAEEIGLELNDEAVQFHSVAYISEHNGFKDRFHFFFIVELTSRPELSLEKGVEYVKWVKKEEIGALSGGRKTYVRLEEMLLSNNAIPYFEV